MKNINKILILLMLISSLLLSIGYSAINNITLDITGKAIAIPTTRILVAGEAFNKMLKNSTSTTTANTTIAKIVFDYWKNGTPIDVDGLGGIKLFKSNDGKNVYILSETQIYANTNCGYMFRNFEGVNEILFNNFNTEKTTFMSMMFLGCSKLTKIDLSNFNTTKVYNMSMMFGSCRFDRKIDLSSFNTSKVQEMNAMFQSCKMSKLNLSNFNTANVK